jgi:hypothetical protein
MNLLYYVAIGKPFTDLVKVSVASVRAGGYTGSITIISDEALDVPTATVVNPGVVDKSKPIHAKKLKAGALDLINMGGFDAVLYCDCDIIATGNITPLFDDIKANPTSLLLEEGQYRGVGTVRKSGKLTKKEETDAGNGKGPSTAILGFVPSPAMKTLLGQWKANTSKDDVFDSSTLFITLAKNTKVGAMRFSPQIGRWVGPAKIPNTLLLHFPQGTHVRMVDYYNGTHAPKPVYVEVDSSLPVEKGTLAYTPPPPEPKEKKEAVKPPSGGNSAAVTLP